MSPLEQKYFHDRLILLLVSACTFLTLLGSLLILLGIDGGRNDAYIVQFRQNLGISAYKTGGVSSLTSFVLFMVLVLVTHIALSIRVYKIHRQFAVTILGLGLLLLTLAIIISNALLVLR